jgi:hypothetical protein
MRTFVWMMLLAAALAATFATGSALEIIAQSRSPAAMHHPVVASEAGRLVPAAKEIGRERIISSARAFPRGED